MGIVTLILKNMLTMFMTKTMIFWGLEQGVKSTDTLVDDHILSIVKGGYGNDPEQVRKGAEALVEMYKARK